MEEGVEDGWSGLRKKVDETLERVELREKKKNLGWWECRGMQEDKVGIDKRI